MLFKSKYRMTGVPYIVDQQLFENAVFLNQLCSDCIYLSGCGLTEEGSSDCYCCQLRIGFDQISEYRCGMYVDCAFHSVQKASTEQAKKPKNDAKKLIREITKRNGITEIDSLTYCMTPYVFAKIRSMLSADDEVIFCAENPVYEHLFDYASDNQPIHNALSFKACDISDEIYCLLNSNLSITTYNVILIPSLNFVTFGCEHLSKGKTMGYAVAAPDEVVSIIKEAIEIENSITDFSEEELDRIREALRGTHIEDTQ